MFIEVGVAHAQESAERLTGSESLARFNRSHEPVLSQDPVMNHPSGRILPAHIESTVEAIAQFHTEHYERSTPLQKLVERATNRAGRPGFVAALTFGVAAWIALNVVMIAMGRPPLDPPPFQWLQGVTTLGALYITLLILVTQRREDQLASHREQLSLELAILGEQKSAKLIELLEELRRDLPMVSNRVDAQADVMSVPTDPHSVLEAIQKHHAENEERAQEGSPGEAAT
jgi:uncharacterized membrane protein